MYNFLRDARTVKNSYLCVFDTIDGFSTNFHINGNVDGWDVYNGIYLYGCWNGTLFGSSYDRSCYIGRTESFVTIPAENFYFVRIMMKITNRNPDKVVGGLTTGKISWTTLSDGVWNSTKEMSFDIIADDEWHLYDVNMGPAQWWQGNINNIRVYPFIDGWSSDQFAIKFIKISSLNNYKCSNTQCDYYVRYSHPCPGAGTRGSCEAGIAAQKYTIIAGSNDTLVINIDGYGNVPFELGTCSGADGPTMSRYVAEKISSLSIGGYAYAECEYTEFDKLKIISGVVGSTSSVTVSGAAAEALGFIQAGVDVSVRVVGTAPANGYDYASSRILTAVELNKLSNGYVDDLAYVHNPSQYNVEGGRSDYNEVGTGRLISTINASEYYESVNNSGRTLIDISHPINANGRIKKLYLYGSLYGVSKFKLLRPHLDGTLTVIDSFVIPYPSASYIYTTRPIAYRVDCDVLVNRGDLIGIYNADVYVGVSLSGFPDASFFQVLGDVTGTFDPGRPKAFGVAGFAIYARGERYQTNVRLDIDMGDRVNIEQVNIYGKEEANYFEFNIASCLDLTWDVNLFGESHYHTGFNWWTGQPWEETHINKYYGKECLDDGIKTADNGQVGTLYGRDSTGIWTGGSNHSYFYVNGDSEWLYASVCNGKTEFCGNNVPGDGIAGFGTALGGFTYDPIAFTLTFPYNRSLPIHKSIVYFKETDNFRQMSLSYYLGANVPLGNADDPCYQYVPSYTMIKLDGILNYPDEEDSVSRDYIFANPMDGRAIYASGDHDPINWEEFGAAMATDWTVIEHNFNPIECKGFRLYTNYHNSTKITEMEVYSKVYTTPSLIDNLILILSPDGEIWKTAYFIAESDTKINAFVGGAPRYFTLDLDCANVFVLNEIEFVVGDQVKLEDCSNMILLDHAKSGETSPSTSVLLENIYGRDLDLIVDLPREKSEIGDVIFWSKLHSQEDLDSPQLGPPAKIYKEEDIEVGNKNYQCAIHCSTYGLKNLIHGKNAYVSYDDSTWEYYGVLSSGVSIDFCNIQYKEILMSCPVSSSDLYWKICFNEVSTSGSLRDIILYHDDEIVEIDQIFINTTSGIYQQNYGTSSNGLNIVPQPIIDNGINFGFKLKYGVVSVNKIKLIYTPTQIVAFDILTSNNNLNNYIIRCGLAKSGSVDQTVSSGVTNAIDYYGSSYPSKAFDNNIATYWESNTMGWPKWIGYDFGVGNAKIIIKAKIYGQHGMPNSFYIQGSNDTAINWNSKVWTDLSTWAGATTAHVWYSTVFWNITPYRFYRFYTPTDTFTFWWAIDEIEFFVRDVYAYPSVTMEKYNSTFDVRFAIDLEKRHALSIIRNYGSGSNKTALSLSSNVYYSGTDSSIIEDVIWDSTYNDARWVNLLLLGGDGVTRYLRKLGIYSNIVHAYCTGGGYNCEWEPMGTVLSDYIPSVNIAYGATVTGTNNYVLFSTPNQAVDGIHTNYSWGDCWAFQTVGGVNAYLELDFEDMYTINKVILYHGYNPADSTYMNTSYTISVSPTTSGSFTTVFTKTGNTSFTTTHQFTPIVARRLRLTVTGYNTSRSVIFDPTTDAYVEFAGSFLREIEVYTYIDDGYVDSETWPVVAMDLQNGFSITGHSLINKDVTDTATDWDNSETNFLYSDNTFSDPKKVSFASSGELVTVYQKIANSGDIYKRSSVFEYLFDSAVYFEKGIYSVEWDAKNSNGTGTVSLRLQGPQIVDHAVTLNSLTYTHQIGTMDILEAGFYDVKGYLDDEYSSTVGAGGPYWAIRNPIIYRAAGLRKWIAITRDTATNYGTPSGVDYLSLVKIYGNTEYKPFEYSWWWDSVVSTISNDPINVIVGTRSLKIFYPAGSGIDVLSLSEGDDLSPDLYFDPKHFLHLWWYVDDINNLDTTFGNLKFGDIYNSDPTYYQWNISGLSLSSGWNDINLKFEDADYFYPAIDSSSFNLDMVNNALDFRTNGRDFKSLVLAYRGIGNSFEMCLDDLRIKRNTFNEDVKFGKGLFLNGYEFLGIPLSSVSLEKGSIEFWMKSFVNYYGADLFDRLNSRVLFTIVNNNNNIVSLGIKSTGWFMPLVGHVRKSLLKFDISLMDLPSSAYLNRGDVVHVGLVWSNDGSFTDNGDTVRLYLNNVPIAASKQTWELDDTKAALIKFGGPNTQLAYNYDIWGGGIFENIKIYDYCKTSFNIDYEGITKDIVYSPNEFLELSQDDVNFYGLGSSNLPFVFEQVPAGDSKMIYIRANKTDNFKKSSLTATLVVEWLSSM